MGKYVYDPSTFKEVFEKEFVYIKGLLRNAKRFGNKSALTCPIRERTWTYRELNEECNKLANALLNAGVRKGDVITYMFPNIAEFVFFYLAPQKIGAINNPINYRLAPGEVAYILDESEPVVFAFESSVMDTAMKAVEMAKHKPEVMIMVDVEGEASPPNGVVDYRDFVRDMPKREPLNEDEIPSTAFDETTRLYTSGTTGLPKGVPINNINEILSAHDVIMHFPLSPLDKTMNMTPWFHRGGLYSGGPNPTLYIGGEVVALKYFNPDLVLDYVEKYKITYLIGAPITAEMIYEAQLKKQRDLSSLKGLCTMGSPLERSACIKYMQVLTPNIMNGYGTTETFWNTFLRPFDLPDKAGSAGRSCTDDDVRVVKVFEDRLAEPNELAEKDNQEVGEVIIKSPAKFAYTYLNPKFNEGRIYKGWYYSKDLATWDENEYVTIIGRKDDMFISGGENIYPVQIEEILNEHPKVADSIVVGVPDEKWGKVCTAYVVPKDPSLTAEELDEYCKNHPMLSRFKRPRYYRFVNELPLTATGKKKHYVVEKMALEDLKEGRLVSPRKS